MEILIAEDDVTSRRMLEAVLEKWGYQVQVVNNGERALEILLEAGSPPLALLDWMMPGIDGVEVCRRVRQNRKDTLPYIVLVTARANKADIAFGLNAGADDYIVKPFDRDELKARVGAGERIVALEQEGARRLRKLQDALDHIKTLQGILPICMYCRRIQSDDASWQRIEEYVAEHSNAEFSHGMCPDCTAKYHPELLKD
ncbi:MAG: response regulator [Candidatus Hydrogenedentes bacterium]|nr:response regulator [Candidatus Hydrogenedentota bacterium]